MNKVLKVFMGVLVMVTVSNSQNLQIFSADNSKGTFNAKSIEKAFNKVGVFVDVNNDMNSIFSKRYEKVHHKKYNLAIFTNKALVAKLMTKYPSIGMITPLSMSIYEDEKSKSINISTLSLAGMARVTKIPETDADLMAYAKLVDEALHEALPTGAYLKTTHKTKLDKPLTSEFTTEFDVEESNSTYTELKDEFKEELEGELGPVGFLIPKSYVYEHADYDFFDTYSIIRFNAIFPVSKFHPDAGAYAPFSLVIYKKKSEETVHIAFPSIDNWIGDLGIIESKTIKAVRETHERVKGILEELTE